MCTPISVNNLIFKMSLMNNGLFLLIGWFWLVGGFFA